MTIAGGLHVGAPRFDDEARSYDAVFVVSYGGPEGPADVLPFLRNATRGRGVPPERLLEVAEHYHHFGGVSPINEQNRALIEALRAELVRRAMPLPIYLGNRNWHPFLEEAILQMRGDGVRRALVLVTSALSSYSGCRQYREDVMRAAAQAGEGAPRFDKIRAFYDHPGFIAANVAHLQMGLGRVSATGDRVAVLFTAHSIPEAMARRCAYEAQLREAGRLVAEAVGARRWSIAYQSRSGPPQVPWLAPDICDRLTEVRQAGVDEVVVLPIGFISDHMEVRYDLDLEANAHAEALGLRFHRVPTVGIHPAFVACLGDLIAERMTEHPERRALGALGAAHDICPVDCCLSGHVPRPGPAGTGG